MRILVIHNYYQQRGGEDSVFEAEVQLLRQYGHTVQTIPFNNNTIQGSFERLKAGLLVVYNPESVKKIEERIKTFQPDIIHVHNFFPIASPSILKVAAKHNIPVVVTLHNFRLICAGALLYREGETCESCTNKTFPIEGIVRACYRNSRLKTASVTLMSSIHKLLGTWRNKVQRYIVLNSFVKNKILNSSLKLHPEQLMIKANFLFDPLTEIQKSDITKTKDHYFLYVGRLSPEKGIETLLAAFQDTSFRLKIVGTGPLEPLVEQTADSSSNIEFCGFQSQAKVLELLQKAKALIVPSVWYENFPMVLLEAFSVGTPIITSNIGGLPNIVEAGFTGYLATPNDIESLQEQCRKIMNLSQFDYQVLCQNARNTYLKLYTPEVNYNRLMEIYSEAINSISAAS